MTVSSTCDRNTTTIRSSSTTNKNETNTSNNNDDITSTTTSTTNSSINYKNYNMTSTNVRQKDDNNRNNNINTINIQIHGNSNNNNNNNNNNESIDGNTGITLSLTTSNSTQTSSAAREEKVKTDDCHNISNSKNNNINTATDCGSINNNKSGNNNEKGNNNSNNDNSHVSSDSYSDTEKLHTVNDYHTPVLYQRAETLDDSDIATNNIIISTPCSKTNYNHPETTTPHSHIDPTKTIQHKTGITATTTTSDSIQNSNTNYINTTINIRTRHEETTATPASHPELRTGDSKNEYSKFASTTANNNDYNLHQPIIHQLQAKGNFKSNQRETEIFRGVPVFTTCPSCEFEIITNTSFQVGPIVFALCFLSAAAGCMLGCCLAPFFIDECKDVVHTCPKCLHTIAKWSRL